MRLRLLPQALGQDSARPSAGNRPAAGAHVVDLFGHVDDRHLSEPIEPIGSIGTCKSLHTGSGALPGPRGTTATTC